MSDPPRELPPDEEEEEEEKNPEPEDPPPGVQDPPDTANARHPLSGIGWPASGRDEFESNLMHESR